MEVKIFYSIITNVWLIVGNILFINGYNKVGKGLILCIMLTEEMAKVRQIHCGI